MDKAIVLDWDGVVFDDDGYKNALLSSLCIFNLDRNALNDLYQKTKDENGFNLNKLCQAVADQCNKSVFEVTKVAERIWDDVASSYIYADAIDFIDRCNTNDYDVIVLTAGSHDLQMKKITSSSLDQVFKEILVVPVVGTHFNKADALRSIGNSYSRIYFYDDKLSTILHLHEEFRAEKKIIPIHVQRYGRINDYMNGYTVPTLNFNDLSEYNQLYSRERGLSTGVMLQSDNAIILVKESAGRAKGLWGLPMGHVDEGQTIQEAAIREVLEETGIDINIHSVANLLAIPGEEYLGGDQDINKVMILTVFRATTVLDEARASEHLWQMHEIDDALNLPLRGKWHSSILANLQYFRD